MKLKSVLLNAVVVLLAGSAAANVVFSWQTPVSGTDEVVIRLTNPDSGLYTDLQISTTDPYGFNIDLASQASFGNQDGSNSTNAFLINTTRVADYSITDLGGTGKLDTSSVQIRIASLQSSATMTFGSTFTAASTGSGFAPATNGVPYAVGETGTTVWDIVVPNSGAFNATFADFQEGLFVEMTGMSNGVPITAAGSRFAGQGSALDYASLYFSGEVVAVPEPATLGLVAFSIVLLMIGRRFVR